MKTQLINQIAEKIRSFGYDVYLSKDQQHGFYTDGKRVVSFGGPWDFFVDFTGNYKPTKQSGTEWGIAKEQSDITPEQARKYITADAPRWTGNIAPTYTTPEQHLKTYGKSSGYSKFEPATVAAC